MSLCDPPTSRKGTAPPFTDPHARPPAVFVGTLSFPVSAAAPHRSTLCLAYTSKFPHPRHGPQTVSPPSLPCCMPPLSSLSLHAPPLTPRSSSQATPRLCQAIRDSSCSSIEPSGVPVARGYEHPSPVIPRPVLTNCILFENPFFKFPLFCYLLFMSIVCDISGFSRFLFFLQYMLHIGSGF